MAFSSRLTVLAARATRVAPAHSLLVRGMASGTVKWFNITKGFGFITPDEPGQPDGASCGSPAFPTRPAADWPARTRPARPLCARARIACWARRAAPYRAHTAAHGALRPRFHSFRSRAPSDARSRAPAPGRPALRGLRGRVCACCVGVLVVGPPGAAPRRAPARLARRRFAVSVRPRALLFDLVVVVRRRRPHSPQCSATRPP